MRYITKSRYFVKVKHNILSNYSIFYKIKLVVHSVIIRDQSSKKEFIKKHIDKHLSNLPHLNFEQVYS